MSDILEILESAASEIRGLRQKVEAHVSILQNITIRQAVNQMKHGPITYDCTAEDWNKLLRWSDESRLAITSSGDVYLDMKLLTKELFESATT